MDWLKVAAATGSGYAAKCFQKFSRDKEGSFRLSSGKSIEEKTDPSSLTRKRRWKNSAEDPSFDKSLSDGRFQGRMSFSSSASVDMAEGDYCDNSIDMCEASTCGVSTLRSPRRGSSLRSRRSNLHHLKPLSSLDSCLMIQLYREHAEVEEHVVMPFLSPCTPAFRSFQVTDGTQLISGSSCDSSNLQVSDGKDKTHADVYPEANEAVFGGIPYLPLVRSQEGSREKNLKKQKDGYNKPGSSQLMLNEMQISSKGSEVLFCLGIYVGIISSILANKAEVTKLHDLLKQTENLVQDLQEEIEMKDSMTMKELANEDNISSFQNDNSTDIKKPAKPPLLVRSDSDVLTIHSVEASYTHKSTDTIESMSIIEAELEAELERLELNMKKSAPRRCLSDGDDEFDPDHVVEIVQGELRADMFPIKPNSDLSLNHCSSSVSTPCSQKQSFSPHELSVRLHQVIQSRLEQHITELESALEKSQKRELQLRSEQQPSSQTEFSSNDDALLSSNSKPSSTMETHREPPLLINLTEEAHREASHQLNKINRPENGTEDEILVIDSRLIDQSPDFPADESEDEDDDMALLIKQIVEKTRQGSPAILNAHKAMFFLDKNEN